MRTLLLVAVALTVVSFASAANAQVVYTYSPVVVEPAPVVTYSVPTTVYASPAPYVAYSVTAPVVTYAAPTTVYSPVWYPVRRGLFGRRTAYYPGYAPVYAW